MEKKEVKKTAPLRKSKRPPYYTLKSKRAQRLIIQEPWSKPMAAQHLAAALIQRNFRRYIGLRKGTKMLKSELKHSTLGSPLNTVSPIASSGDKTKGFTAPDEKTITARARLSAKFKRSHYFPSDPTNEQKALKHFCAAKIQAAYKMSLTRRLVKYHRFPMYHIAAIQIQWAWRSFRQRLELLRPKRSPEDLAALKIQKAWRAFMNVKIFKYYKDFINFREKGDPSMLIKSINPQEAILLDAASQVHV